MTLCSTYGTTNFTLVFSGTTLGDRHHSTRTQRRLATPVGTRHNAWSTTPVLDSSYPAIVWEHTLSVYKESSGRLDFASWFWGLHDKYKNKPYPLELRTSSGDVVVAFGNCVLESDTLEEPKELLLTKAGIVQLVFLGTSCPSLN